MTSGQSNRLKTVLDAVERLLVGGALVILPLLVLAYFGLPAILAGKTEMQFFLQAIITNLIPVLLLFLLSYFLLYRYVEKLRSQQQSDELADQVAKTVVESLNQKRENDAELLRSGRHPIPYSHLIWLYEGNDLCLVEAEARSDVWIVSPHLKNDTGTESEGGVDGVSTNNIVVENLKRGVKYTYVVPDSDAIRERLPLLRQVYSRYLERTTFIQIPTHEFRDLVLEQNSELVFFDALQEGQAAPKVFTELPVTNPHDYWAQLADKPAIECFHRVQNVIRQHQ